MEIFMEVMYPEARDAPMMSVWLADVRVMEPDERRPSPQALYAELSAQLIGPVRLVRVIFPPEVRGDNAVPLQLRRVNDHE
jgi:hypothetical protein